ncbi:copper resistance protein CopD [Pseudomonas azotoformans]|uniref:Copper resistance protein D n=1 Tax=Pseudomonas azotoformans TaxID=47878 RepID=A0A1V2JUE7_PSEAZ|nr:copper homeostasis membrane protein CopD [Pseudomonas azotoformans]OIN49056.1 copper resistance protein CopD [Pseudomonas azotoformans]ONH48436.1 copper resistance protein CopD [Pseudomonas azotoformans]SDN72071.1 putative copper resistance protein D [Pseudomonas azotoformans]
MSEVVPILLRFALYLDLMLVFGLGLFGLYGDRRLWKLQPLLRLMACLGVLLSVASLLSMTQAMSGAEDWQTLWPHLQMMLGQTELGGTWGLRVVALMLVVLSTRLAPLFGALALVTLAWAGHGVMHEGALGLWHVLSDSAHLLAAGGWVGALAAFGLALRRRSLPALHRLAHALAGFGRMGAVFVAVLIGTGVANYLFVVGPNLDGINGGTYAVLLCFKLGLFGLMLGLAALNRSHFTPLLQRALAAGDITVASRALRRSIALESAAVVLILALVAWLGTLAPG